MTSGIHSNHFPHLLYLDFQPPSEGLSTGAIVGIVLAVLSTILIALGILWWKGCLQNKNALEQGSVLLNWLLCYNSTFFPFIPILN